MHSARISLAQRKLTGLIAFTGVVAAAAIVIAVAVAADGPGRSPTAAPAAATTLSAGERRMVAVARASADPRLRRIAASVLRDEAGALALADPQLLYHHQLDTRR